MGDVGLERKKHSWNLPVEEEVRSECAKHLGSEVLRVLHDDCKPKLSEEDPKVEHNSEEDHSEAHLHKDRRKKEAGMAHWKTKSVEDLRDGEEEVLCELKETLGKIADLEFMVQCCVTAALQVMPVMVIK